MQGHKGEGDVPRFPRVPRLYSHNPHTPHSIAAAILHRVVINVLLEQKMSYLPTNGILYFVHSSLDPMHVRVILI